MWTQRDVRFRFTVNLLDIYTFTNVHKQPELTISFLREWINTHRIIFLGMNIQLTGYFGLIWCELWKVLFDATICCVWCSLLEFQCWRRMTQDQIKSYEFILSLFIYTNVDSKFSRQILNNPHRPSPQLYSVINPIIMDPRTPVQISKASWVAYLMDHDSAWFVIRPLICSHYFCSGNHQQPFIPALYHLFVEKLGMVSNMLMFIYIFNIYCIPFFVKLGTAWCFHIVLPTYTRNLWWKGNGLVFFIFLLPRFTQNSWWIFEWLIVFCFVFCQHISYL